MNGVKNSVIFLCFILLVEGKMWLNCEILIVNWLVFLYNMWNVSKLMWVFLVIGWKEILKYVVSENWNVVVFFLVCIVKERNGVKYKVFVR